MNNKILKLNKKNTIYIGFAFFAILMLWQIYNNYCPLILEYLLASKFEGQKLYYIIGVIMALDNLASLIIMPIVGILSDKTKTKFGKRMPYILIGMLGSLIIFPFIALMFIWNSFVGVVIAMLLILIIMQSYRSPAVALMPDITPKPLRSKANGIINLIGYFGAVFAAVLGMVFSVKEDSSMSDAQGVVLIPFLVTSLLMIIIMVVLFYKFRENQILKEMKEDLEIGEQFSENIDKVEENKPLSKENKRNLILILIAIFFWFLSFNAVETFNSLFTKNILGNSGIHGTFTIILTFSSILTFLFGASLSLKIGRKWTIIIGLICIVFGFTVFSVYTYTIAPNNIWLVYILTVIIGAGWALVNINSYPMIVEMATSNNVGKYTGYYYSGSLLAQTVTPILVGLIMSFNDAGLKALYIYSSICMFIALLVFYFIKENKEMKAKLKKSAGKKGLELLDVDN